MKGHQLAGEGGRRAPSWYLAKGDKRYGPLADRELLLLAERGGLHTDDLLWKPGFTSWKSVHSVCRANASYSIHMPRSVPPQDAEYLPTQEVSGGQAEIADVVDVKGTLKPKVVERCSTDEIQTDWNMLDDVRGQEAEFILRERELTPNGKLARRIHNSAAWTLAFSLGTFIVALGIFWLTATGYRLP
jgi:hypothetical protein